MDDIYKSRIIIITHQRELKYKFIVIYIKTIYKRNIKNDENNKNLKIIL